MSGMKGSLKEPSGLVSRFLRGREDGAEIRNDFHFLYRANYVQRCFFLSFFFFPLARKIVARWNGGCLVSGQIATQVSVG